MSYMDQITLKHRLAASLELRNSIRAEHITNKHILDVGARDGINAMMLLNQLNASSVVALDKDASMFPSEQSQGLTFIHKSLQDFAMDVANGRHKIKQKFDTITVFMWCVYIDEYTSFLECCKFLLEPNGILIIGVHDNCYAELNNRIGVQWPAWNSGFTGPMDHFERNTYNRWLFYNRKRQISE